jgi:hypothetical protein
MIGMAGAPGVNVKICEKIGGFLENQVWLIFVPK